jgi:hypothetical protein
LHPRNCNHQCTTRIDHCCDTRTGMTALAVPMSITCVAALAHCLTPPLICNGSTEIQTTVRRAAALVIDRRGVGSSHTSAAHEICDGSMFAQKVCHRLNVKQGLLTTATGLSHSHALVLSAFDFVVLSHWFQHTDGTYSVVCRPKSALVCFGIAHATVLS